LGGGLSYNYSEESPHTEWLEDAVDNERDQGIPWVVAGAHAQCITIGVRERCTMGQGLFDELVEAKVDLILAGGDHAYERSKQLRQSDSCESVNSTGPADPSCVADGGSQDIYPKGDRTVTAPLTASAFSPIGSRFRIPIRVRLRLLQTLPPSSATRLVARWPRALLRRQPRPERSDEVAVSMRLASDFVGPGLVLRRELERKRFRVLS